MERPTLEPRGFFRRIPLLPHQKRDRITATADAIVLCHLGVPRLDRDAWSLAIDGLLAQPRVLGFDDLARYPKATVTSMHQCAGSPLDPREPMRRICNMAWSGARLADILADCRPAAAAKYVWSYGADYGEFGGVSVDAYVKDMPLARAADDVLVAYELNGAPLPPEHGFPARLVVPGFYGTNSVKWLVRITLAESRPRGPFTTRFYNDPVRDADGRDTGQSAPVWAIAPESLIVSPAADAAMPVGAACEIWGWAWADGGVGKVEIATDDALTWAPAELEPPRGREWQRFSLPWTPQRAGQARLAARAYGMNGTCQPASGWRNAIHRVAVTIV